MSEKKRSTYVRGSETTLPGHVDKKKYGYRWLNASRIAAATDGYEARGYEVDKDINGNVTRRGDMILGRMPIDVFEDMKAQKEDDRINQIKLLKDFDVAQDEVIAHELKKAGGKFKFSQD